MIIYFWRVDDFNFYQTGADGMLNLTDQCMGVNYIIQKDGYISVEISTSNLGTDSIKIIDMAELGKESVFELMTITSFKQHDFNSHCFCHLLLVC